MQKQIGTGDCMPCGYIDAMKPTASTRWLLRNLKRPVVAFEIIGVAPADLLRVCITLQGEGGVLLDTSGSGQSTAGELIALQAAKHRISGLLVLMDEIDAANKREFANEVRIDLWLTAAQSLNNNARSCRVFDLELHRT